ncbi:MAG: hypothetical protein HY556_03960 [Euryarchaeota archaeon]|nr:hypothetical protein [Euryarchaeota archaeon]
MITLGLDIGAGTTKAALVEEGRKVLATSIVPTKGDLGLAGRSARDLVMQDANVLPGELDYVCTTGFGRYAFQERDLQVSDITSSARGAFFLAAGTRHVVDIGTQSSRAIAVNDRGRVVRFKMNEKCAAGAGRFVDRCSKYLQIPLAEMGPKALVSENPRTISSVCAVLAETEIINYVAEEAPLADILMGVFLSLSQRAHALMRNVGIEPEVVLVGGMVHNPGLVSALRKVTSLDVRSTASGHHAAAIGCAVLGHARLLKTGGPRKIRGSRAPLPGSVPASTTGVTS